MHKLWAQEKGCKCPKSSNSTVLRAPAARLLLWPEKTPLLCYCFTRQFQIYRECVFCVCVCVVTFLKQKAEEEKNIFNQPLLAVVKSPDAFKGRVLIWLFASLPVWTVETQLSCQVRRERSSNPAWKQSAEGCTRARLRTARSVGYMTDVSCCCYIVTFMPLKLLNYSLNLGEAAWLKHVCKDNVLFYFLWTFQELSPSCYWLFFLVLSEDDSLD